ncbi:helix-turn-helix domain-containing protein [Rhizobium sp. CFBP 8762]|uniref:helix-turn-helix domain-containing protein n=1 Tax=Rhizobium sp. CFBP 8762 TaxID=2775279 RepID=UPI001783AA7B|nr:helix-turn-helix domain-containing protein [Rhizobium sp. CFBP 8762]MBD8555070.1 helix-turn-helix domain-containing protein [Rhizobium sp. CFBP 8762]
MLKLFRFDSGPIDEHQRMSAWTETLGGLGAKSVCDASPRNFKASVNGLKAPWGFAMLRLEISPQHISLDTRSRAGGIWLARILKGAGALRTERGSLVFSAGDVIVGKIPRAMRLTASAETAIDIVQFTEFHSGSRLTSLATPAVGLSLGADHGATTFLADLLALATARIGSISSEELRPLEITLVEFLMAAIASTGAAANLIDGSRSKNAIALRATQAIELKLSDPKLSPSGLADYLGISLRYLQKLFEDAGENANTYIRRRRLERSYHDLADPLYHSLSIAEISYRWGFNDSAYFSRAFKERYGVSPSQHRGYGRWREKACSQSHGGLRITRNSHLLGVR